MALRYDKKSRDHGESGTQWTSYSDLFLALSVIFLLLYVVSSLRQGTSGAAVQQEQQKLTQQVKDLKQQLAAYETLKEDYMKNGASDDESAMYENLMKHLNLLQDDAKNEKNDLRAKATENEKKERALNQYQQMIRNIMNSNMVASARIKKRDTIIVKKDATITDKKAEIVNLESVVSKKENQIEQDEKTIETVSAKLDQRLKQLRNSYKAHNITKKKMEMETARLKAESENKVRSIEEQKQQVASELQQAKGQLNNLASELNQTSQQLNSTKGALNQTAQQLNATKGALNQTKEELDSTKGALDATAGELNNTKGALNQTKGALDATKGELNNAKGALNETKGALDATKGELNNTKGALNATKGALNATKGALEKAEFEKGALAGKMNQLGGELAGTKGELARATATLNAKKNLANQIQKNFAAHGIKADVDTGSGDVLISFGEQYFDTGHAELKDGMKKIIEKAVPVYSDSLFKDPKIAEKISSVEIVGFASPTFKGKYIDPNSLSQTDRQAVDFNLDLSYARARSIFQYVFDTNKMTFNHQKELLPLVKVTGRSFLSQEKGARTPAAGAKDFCHKNDCAKAQRVIIKFTLKD